MLGFWVLRLFPGKGNVTSFWAEQEIALNAVKFLQPSGSVPLTDWLVGVGRWGQGVLVI